ncbi:LacI family transcriptional regulator [Fructilactobacillus myrtifloralis]|uniref:LacI family transcriptional regulator n=1 Tax=Fructilactobacillus myrtifloralis TaxID=2940301 RepID=A0ABY5BTY7_9LACO|nr:LacI family DNA-binding transcriptional regulator [Fructilactobacillus myrtifloralis]USS85713.1 LacI family transcriptional regulator [Fructilactobacillus myrtifloralis]
MNKITIYDVAQEAGLSITSVSRFINQKEELLSDKTQRKIKAAIKKLNYVPASAARDLRRKEGQQNNVAIIVDDISNPFSNNMFKGIENKLLSFGIKTYLLDSNQSATNQAELLTSLDLTAIDGVILQPINLELAPLKPIFKKQIPVIFINCDVPSENCPAVTLDDFDSAQQVARKFKQQEHSNHVYIVGNNNYEVSSIRDRIDGVKHVFGEQNTDLLEPGFSPTSTNHSYQQLLRKLDQNPQALAFFLKERWFVDFLLFASHNRTTHLQPEKQLTGFTSTELVKKINPDVKTIKCNPVRVGEVAALRLLGRSPHKRIVVQTSFG